MPIKQTSYTVSFGQKASLCSVQQLLQNQKSEDKCEPALDGPSFIYTQSVMDKPYPGKITFRIMLSLLSGNYQMGHLGHPFQDSAKTHGRGDRVLWSIVFWEWHGCCTPELSSAVISHMTLGPSTFWYGKSSQISASS